jgi:hypothetical protein
MSKLIIKYVRIVDNTGYENYLEKEKVYGVLEKMTGDLFHYYRLDVNTPYQDGLWVNKSRCGDITNDITSDTDSDMDSGYPFSGVELKHTIDLPSMLKQPIQRIICIPDEGGHIVDLQRVQYISPIDNGSYKVTLVSGWEMPLTDKLYSREKLIGLWRGLQNKQA